MTRTASEYPESAKLAAGSAPLGVKRTAVRNNGGGHANHSLFWDAMSPSRGGEPEGAFADAIDAIFWGTPAPAERRSCESRMADYEHELPFGTFITPQNQWPHDGVALAQPTEQMGLDLVTFQDHPY
jgi:hypothetical protein